MSQSALEFEYYELAVPPRYRVDLAAYMRTCDQNYCRLLKLVPALESGRPSYTGDIPAVGSRWEFVSDKKTNNKMIIRVRLLEFFKYTSTLEISVSFGFPKWTPAPLMLVRMYHDAATAEPLSYQGHRQVPAKSLLPNADMYHQDEKRQINEFLAEWLDWCSRPGVIARSSDILCVD
ncbi:MAG: DUF1249 domain-containing protein [Pseudohongiella sp.]|nr:DUF1249 domain-containing protein [Pseudohongiella sp.]MDO9518892.1 DUF1249 domain-containing protein [Pseudohongiella sp.]